MGWKLRAPGRPFITEFVHCAAEVPLKILIVRLFDGNFPPPPFAEGEAFPDFPVGIAHFSPTFPGVLALPLLKTAYVAPSEFAAKVPVRSS